MIILHGEQRYEIYKSLKPGAKYINEIKVGDIQDKVKGMLLILEIITYEILENNTKVPVCK